MKDKEREALWRQLKARKEYANQKVRWWEKRWEREFNAMSDGISHGELEASQQLKYWQGVSAGLNMAMGLVAVWNYEWKEEVK